MLHVTSSWLSFSSTIYCTTQEETSKCVQERHWKWDILRQTLTEAEYSGRTAVEVTRPAEDVRAAAGEVVVMVRDSNSFWQGSCTSSIRVDTFTVFPRARTDWPSWQVPALITPTTPSDSGEDGKKGNEVRMHTKDKFVSVYRLSHGSRALTTSKRKNKRKKH